MEKRIAVVTGGNKGIGLEICRQLASNGVRVILTARDEKRGLEAVEKLKQSGFSDVIFHRLDVTDSSGIASFADFVKIMFGKLDILVNNAAIGGVAIDTETLNYLKIESEKKAPGVAPDLLSNLQESYDMAEECLKTNFHGTKDVTEALIPLLLTSNSGRIVNVSSQMAQLKLSSSNKLMEVLTEGDGLTEEKLAELSSSFLEDFKRGKLQCNGWPTTASAYIVSKALVNSYTRILAKKYPSLLVNCVNPGFVKTDINWNTGILTVEEGAKGPVMLALMDGLDRSGLFFDQTEESTF